MAWKKSNTTPHSCGGVHFGHLSPLGECKRCDELRNGAKPVKSWNADKIKWDEQRKRSMAEHFKPGGKHDEIVKNGGVDTAFDWFNKQKANSWYDLTTNFQKSKIIS